MFEDSPLVDEHPYYGDQSNYFPTQKNWAALNFEPIAVNQNVRENKSVLWVGHQFNLNKLIINDSHLFDRSRET